MQKSPSRAMSAIMPLWMILSLSCSSQAIHSQRALNLKTLEISPTVPGFQWSWEECTKRFLGICRKTELKTEYYDLTDPQIRQKLIDMDFVAKVRNQKALP